MVHKRTTGSSFDVRHFFSHPCA